MTRRPTTGMVIPPWEGRARAKALEQVKDKGRREGAPCVLCEQEINYDLDGNHPFGCTVQHLMPKSIYPELTWSPSNWAPAHRECNLHAGNKIIVGAIGITDL
jgi:5-methylcytosine-specific restriction endonuclease McrA